MTPVRWSFALGLFLGAASSAAFWHFKGASETEDAVAAKAAEWVADHASQERTLEACQADREVVRQAGLKCCELAGAK